MRGGVRDSPVKRELLKQLRRKDVVSGDKIAQRMEISRVAVWKHIKELNMLGYEILSTPKGYALIREAYKPYPWELDFEVYYFKEVWSTMDIAKELAEEGKENVFIIAEKQKGGRGRLGRNWVSQEGGLYFSLVVRPKIALKDVDKLVFPISSAIVEILDEYGISAEMASNGDIFVGNKKLAGILIEAEGEIDLLKYAIVGVGVNVNNPVPEEATSLKRELGKEINLLEFTRVLFLRINHHLLKAIF